MEARSPVSRMDDRVLLRLTARSITLALACRPAQDGELRMEMSQILVTTSLLIHESIHVSSDLQSAISGSGVTKGCEAR